MVGKTAITRTWMPLQRVCRVWALLSEYARREKWNLNTNRITGRNSRELKGKARRNLR